MIVAVDVGNARFGQQIFAGFNLIINFAQELFNALFVAFFVRNNHRAQMG